MPRLIGELLVKSGACSADAVRAGLQNQVIFGGRLGTNLLELGLVEEEALARALGQRYGAPHLWGPTPLDPAATRLISGEQAGRWELVPYVLSDRRLAVLACDPTNLAALDEAAFTAGRSVQAIVAPQARIWAHLRAAYGLVRQLRGIRLDPEPGHAPGGEVAPGGSGRPAPTGAGAPAAPAAGELMDEASFEALYASRPAPAAPARPPSQAALDSPQSQAAGHPPQPEDDIIELTEEVVEPPPLPAPPTPEPPPLGFEEAVAALAGVTGRDAIAHLVLRYARRRLRRAVLLTVHGGEALGWVGLGEGLTPRRVEAIRLALGTPGVLDTVVRTRSHYLGPLPRTEANVRLLRALGGGVPANALLVPILALGRVVNVIYADGGRGALVDAGGVGELLILATRIAQSYRAMLERL